MFGTAATPRVSVAAYLRPPSSTDALGDTKVLVKTRPDFAGTRGEECWLTFDKTRWHLFAADTGMAYY